MTTFEAGVPWRKRDAAVVSGLTFVAQVVSLGAQVVFATIFGASAETDAFFAALALPLYVGAVLISAVPVVFVPLFLEQRARSGPESAAAFAATTLNVTATVLVAVSLIGMVGARPLLALTAPGLPGPAAERAAELARILWPSVIGTGLIAVLTARWQVEGRFAQPAVVPLAGAVAYLVILIALSPAIGILGAAVAWTASLALQSLLLLPIAIRPWSTSLALQHPALLALAAGIAPLAVANVLIRASVLLERWLGSLLAEGDLSHVTYASRIALAIGAFMAAGPGTAIFPRLAEDVASGDRAALVERLSAGLRSLWIIVAPIVALTVALAQPGIRAVFEHGNFTRADADAVATLLRWYTPAIAGVGLAAVTAHALYALRATRLLAVAGAAEGLAYVIYTPVLTRILGVTGIALGFSIYYGFSVVWQLLYIRRVTEARGTRLARSFLSTGVLAGVAGAAGWVVADAMAHTPVVALLTGAAVTAAVYAAGLLVIRRI